MWKVNHTHTANQSQTIQSSNLIESTTLSKGTSRQDYKLNRRRRMLQRSLVYLIRPVTPGRQANDKRNFDGVERTNGCSLKNTRTPNLVTNKTAHSSATTTMHPIQQTYTADTPVSSTVVKTCQ